MDYKLDVEPLDEDGYPTEEFIEYLKKVEPDTLDQIQEIISLIEEAWCYRDMAFKKRRPRNGIQSIEMHTCGWSGNEAIIDAVISNGYLTYFKLQYYKWITGGHYYFKLKLK